MKKFAFLATMFASTAAFAGTPGQYDLVTWEKAGGAAYPNCHQFQTLFGGASVVYGVSTRDGNYEAFRDAVKINRGLGVNLTTNLPVHPLSFNIGTPGAAANGVDNPGTPNGILVTVDCGGTIQFTYAFSH